MTETSKINQLVAWLSGLSEVAIGLTVRLQLEFKRADARHLRAAQLVALRRRHRWKGGDRSAIDSLGLSPTAQVHFERRRKRYPRSRPTLVTYVPLSLALRRAGFLLERLTSPTTPPLERLKALRQTRWHHDFLEAVYRGELARFRSDGAKSPSEKAEESTGKVFIISSASVRRAAEQVRTKRRCSADFPAFPSMTASEFTRWLASGDLPDERAG